MINRTPGSAIRVRPPSTPQGIAAQAVSNSVATFTVQNNAITAIIKQQTTTSVTISSTPTQVASINFTPVGGYVKVSCFLTYINQGGAAAGTTRLTLYKGTSAGTVLDDDGGFPIILANDNRAQSRAGVDSNAPINQAQQYTAYASSNVATTVIYVTFIVENSKR